MIEVGPHIDFVLAKLRWMREQKYGPMACATLDRCIWRGAVSFPVQTRPRTALPRRGGMAGGHTCARTTARDQDRRGIPDNIPYLAWDVPPPPPMDRDYESLSIDQDLGLGMMLWLAHFFPDEPWAKVQIPRALAMLDRMWVDPPGYFCRAPQLRQVKFAFYKLRRLARASGRATTAGSRHPAQFVLRHLPVE